MRGKVALWDQHLAAWAEHRRGVRIELPPPGADVNGMINTFVRRNLNSPDTIARAVRMYGLDLPRVLQATGFTDAWMRNYVAKSGSRLLREVLYGSGRPVCTELSGNCQDLRLVKLSEAQASAQGARCLDGSPPAMYVARNPSSTKWVIALQGGGWCGSPAECAERARTTLGSSTQLPAVLPANETFQMLSSVRATNPHMHTWNRVYLRYCDGAMWTSDAPEPIGSGPTGPLYARGARNLRALIGQLVTAHGLGRATDVLYSGCSAGSVGAYASADAVRAMLPSTTRFKAAPLAGWLPNLPVLGTADRMFFAEEMARSCAMHGCVGGLNAECVAAQAPGREFRCIFPQEAAPFIRTPLFVEGSLFDQVFVYLALLEPQQREQWRPCLLDLAACTPAQKSTLVQGFAAPTRDQVASAVQSRAGRGAFMHSILTHCGEMDGLWSTASINDVTLRDAVHAWFNGKPAVYLAQLA